jgi:hypothetical protein
MTVDQATIRMRNNAAVRKFRYGITQDQYDTLLAEQNNSCAVCEVPFSDVVKPRIDHDRNCCPTANTCGQCLRGILCPECTSFARYIETRFDIIEDMFKYLRVHLEARTNNLINVNAQGGVI